MSETFTKGPWVTAFGKNNPSTRYVIAEDDDANGGKLIAMLHGTDKNANCELIATAPELRALLVEAAEFIQPFNSAQDLLDRIDAVLAKSRGAA